MGYNVSMRVEIELTDKLKEYVDDYIDIGGGENVFCYPDNIIKAIREGIERQTGEWVNDENHIPICSKCGYIPPYNRVIDDYEYSNFCPSCGARMTDDETNAQ